MLLSCQLAGVRRENLNGFPFRYLLFPCKVSCSTRSARGPSGHSTGHPYPRSRGTTDLIEMEGTEGSSFTTLVCPLFGQSAVVEKRRSRRSCPPRLMWTETTGLGIISIQSRIRYVSARLNEVFSSGTRSVVLQKGAAEAAPLQVTLHPGAKTIAPKGRRAAFGLRSADCDCAESRVAQLR
jgi:hypothetical protein